MITSYDSEYQVDVSTITLHAPTTIEQTLLSDKVEGGGEGRRKWLVLVATFLGQIMMYGYNSTFGLYLEAYQSDIFKHLPRFQVTFIGSLGLGVALLNGLWVPLLQRRIGLTPMLILGALLQITGMLLASFAVKLWQLYLTQGVLFGLGGSCIFYGTIALPAQWFSDRHRALANGISLCGSGIGTAILAPLTKLAISSLGYRTALRYTSLIYLVMALIIIGCARERESTQYSIRAMVQKATQALVTNKRRYALLIMHFTLSPFGYPVFFLPQYVRVIGYESLAGLCLSVMMISSTLGRILIGALGDKYNSSVIAAFSTLIASLACFIIWPFATNAPLLWIFCITFGFFSGGYVSLQTIVAGKHLGMDNLSENLGLLYSCNAVGAFFGSPIMGAILDVSKHSSFFFAQVYAGAVLLLAAVPLFFLILLPPINLRESSFL